MGLGDAYPANANVAYAIVLFVACTSSGGTILGVGAFSAKVTAAGLLSAHDAEGVFNVGFQLLTWISLVWSLLHDTIGPRACAVCGLLVAACGHFTIALAATAGTTNPLVYAIGYGLIGGGGNGAYLCSFHFASLFPRTQGTRCALLGGAFNVAGFVLMLLNIPQVSLPTFFFTLGGYAIALTLVCLVIFPDEAYVVGDSAALTCPAIFRCRGDSQPAVATTDRCRATACCRATADALRLALPSLRLPRYWGFCLTFSWAALCQQWSSGAIGAGVIFPDAEASYLEWAVPTLTNATFLLTPLVGALIDRRGFRLPGLLLIATTELVIGCLWLRGAGSQWLSLMLICALAALAYSIQFAYLTMAFPPAAYPGLLTVTLAVQGAFGFISWPLLTEVQPFGPDPSTGNFLLLGAPTLLLYVWPLLLQGEDDRQRALRPAMASASRGTADVSLLDDPGYPAARRGPLSDSVGAPANPAACGSVVPLTAPVAASSVT